VTDTVTTVSNLEVYLCGNGRMIRDVRTIVREKGLCPIYTEQYFS
jgi:NAD(P)H-flavin reductase